MRSRTFLTLLLQLSPVLGSAACSLRDQELLPKSWEESVPVGCSSEEVPYASQHLMRIRGVGFLVVFFIQGFLRHAVLL